jgi:hypothetical protein
MQQENIKNTQSFIGILLMSSNALLNCTAVVVDFCAKMSAAKAQKGTKTAVSI